MSDRLDRKKTISKILNWIKGTVTRTYTLSSSNWTASKCTFTSGVLVRYGDVVMAAVTVKLTQAITAGTEFDIGTLTHPAIPAGSMRFGVAVQGSLSLQTSGLIRLRTAFALANNGNLYLRIMYMGV